MEKKKLTTELPKEMAGRFKEWCRDMHIEYHPSECYNLIHFVCYMTEEQRIAADEFVDKMDEEFKAKEMRERIREMAYQQGGFRERYAMDNGNEKEVEFGGDTCLRYDYDKNDPYQDANGAMYDIDRGRWIY